MNLNQLPRIPISRSSFGSLPEAAGIYIYWKSDSPIYIGKAINLKSRLRSYLTTSLESKTQRMLAQARSISFIKVGSEIESLLLEAHLIRKYQPQYNITAKDDKHPLYIKISNDEYPRIITARKKDLKNTTYKSYGPFPQSSVVYSVLRMLRRIFPFSDHKIGKRPCLYSHIGLCNPCPNDIENLGNPEEKKRLKEKYLTNIRMINFCMGRKINLVQDKLNRQLKLLSRSQRFEQAKLVQDAINKLSYITSPITPSEHFLENPNFVEDIRTGEVKSLEAILGSYLKIKRKLTRIECFDVAHLAGSKQTASMVTFISGEPEKKFYRHFRIYKAKRSDDISALKEVAERRAKHFKDWGRPDLIVVDGGKGQVSTFVTSLAKHKILIVGLAKRLETLVIPTQDRQKFITFELKESPAGNLLTRIRDEAHRFARRYHHKLVRASLLDSSY